MYMCVYVCECVWCTSVYAHSHTNIVGHDDDDDDDVIVFVSVLYSRIPCRSLVTVDDDVNAHAAQLIYPHQRLRRRRNG